MSLDEIAIKHQTDKASQFSRTYAQPHDYCRHLDRFFDALRYNPIKLLEIGVGGGESIQTWLEYFPQAKVFGIDMVHDTNPWNTPKLPPHERYKFIHGDQSSMVFWKSFVAMHGGDWDIIIDDGSHISNHMIVTFNFMWDFVKSGGLYEVEDLGVAPEADQFFHNQRVNSGRGIDSIYFARELAIFKKL